MSDLLSSIDTATSTGLDAALRGVLRTASFRGVVFGMLDSTHADGQRWHRFLFPGRSATRHEAIGAVTGPIEVQALLLGDDYVSRARRLAAAAQQPTPAQLRHPWLGTIKVVAARPPSIKFEDGKLRLATVTLVFERWQPDDAASAVGTLTGLLDQLDQLLDDAQDFLADALAPLGTALSLLGTVQSACGTVGGLWATVTASAPADAAVLSAAAAAAIDALTGGVAIDPASDLAAQAAPLLAAVPAAIADAGEAADEAAVGPGPVGPQTLSPDADPRACARVLLAVASTPVPASADAAGAALWRTARVQAVAEAARVGAATDWESRDEAMAWRGTITAAIAAVRDDLVASAASGTAVRTPGPLWRSLQAVSSAAVRDLNERVGRLAAVRHITTTDTLSAWQIALAVAGDTPAAIRPAMLDLVRRNRIVNPAAVPAGRLEVLVRGH